MVSTWNKDICTLCNMLIEYQKGSVLYTNHINAKARKIVID